MSTIHFANGRTRLRPFNYNPMASGCVGTVMLIKARSGPILIVINDEGETQPDLSTQQIAKPKENGLLDLKCQ